MRKLLPDEIGARASPRKREGVSFLGVIVFKNFLHKVFIFRKLHSMALEVRLPPALSGAGKYTRLRGGGLPRPA